MLHQLGDYLKPSSADELLRIYVDTNDADPQMDQLHQRRDALLNDLDNS